MRRWTLAPILVVATSCSSDRTDSSPSFLLAPPSQQSPIAKIHFLEVPTDTMAVGTRLVTVVSAFDARGRRIDGDEATVTSSDSTVAVLVDRIVARINGEARGLELTFLITGPGTATLRATLAGVSDSISVHAVEVEEGSDALAIDEFRVIEYHVPCTGGCPYLAYFPELAVRRTTAAPVAVVGVEVGIPTKTTGLCTGGIAVNRSGVQPITKFNSYDWFSDLLIVQWDGTPVPDGKATVRIIVRDASGRLGNVRATGPIERSAHQPPIDPDGGGGNYNCPKW